MKTRIYQAFLAIALTCLMTACGSDEENTSVSLDLTTLTMGTGDSNSIVATVTPAGTPITWTSSDTNVATVSSNGTVTALYPGTATITATVGNITATCTITVKLANAFLFKGTLIPITMAAYYIQGDPAYGYCFAVSNKVFIETAGDNAYENTIWAADIFYEVDLPAGKLGAKYLLGSNLHEKSWSFYGFFKHPSTGQIHFACNPSDNYGTYNTAYANDWIEIKKLASANMFSMDFQLSMTDGSGVVQGQYSGAFVLCDAYGDVGEY
jgi:hypothetical protein